MDNILIKILILKNNLKLMLKKQQLSIFLSLVLTTSNTISTDLTIYPTENCLLQNCCLTSE